MTDFIPGLQSDRCHICLCPFEQQPVGSLQNCNHGFCLDCILQWSQTANTCPVDRISFAFIHQRQHPGGNIQQKIEVKKQKKVIDAEEERDGIICEECGRSDRRHRLLVCIQCDSGYHMDCLTSSSSNTNTEGDWICPECAANPHNIDDSIEEEEIRDGELTDLLAEADETASTSSRLRSSTINRLSSSTGQRHSQRIQSRASKNPNPTSRSPLHVPKYLLKATSAVELDALYFSDTTNASDKSKKRKRK
ncbi:hypothetical protein LDENG_00120790 [Lucifuga dentata]|nr:hypothetical protein LDENG_00120790 [Lucifuga dentata]